jgi:hypothetical protein
MINYNRWRDQQLSGFSSIFKQPVLLEQESRMLEFVQSCPAVVWRWIAPITGFRSICQDHVRLGSGTGVIAFGPILDDLTTGQLVRRVQELTAGQDHAYIAINRYEITEHDLPLDLPDSIEDSLDLIMQQANAKFKRLYRYPAVDGEHMVAAHPMDCYTLCK